MLQIYLPCAASARRRTTPRTSWWWPATSASAETINGLYKAEVIHRRGPWRSFEAVEFATFEWVDWFNTRRLLEPIGILVLHAPVCPSHKSRCNWRLYDGFDSGSLL